ncbi:hypothetical protein Tco_1086361 [Tanacetum coccineum]
MSVKTPTYVNLESSTKEHQNEKTPSPSPRKKYLSPPHAPSKSTSSRSTHYTSSSSPDESLYDAWTHFKDLLQKVPHHGLDLWLQVQIFYDHVDYTTQMAIDYAAGERHRKLRLEEAWEIIKDLAKYEEEEWNEPIFSEKGSPDYIDANWEQELESIEHRVESLMRSEVLLYYEGGFTSLKRPYQEEFEGKILKLIDD